MALNTGNLDWESSTLTTQPCKKVYCVMEQVQILTFCKHICWKYLNIFLKCVRKPEVYWCFQGTLKESSAIKWVKSHFIFSYLLLKIVYTTEKVLTGFKLAVRNSQFAKCSDSLQMSFCIFHKKLRIAKIRYFINWVSHWTSYFKLIKYPLLNNVISQKFIVHINFKLHTSFFSNYHFVTI